MSRTRYSSEELKEFETIIDGKLSEAREELEVALGGLRTDGEAGSSGAIKLGEDNSKVLEQEMMAQHASRQHKFIKNLENALFRIKKGTYGVCRKTGDLISKERLRAVPHTTLSIKAKNMRDGHHVVKRITRKS